MRPLLRSAVRWTAAVSSAWDNARNWNTSSIPTASDAVYFDTLSSTVLMNASVYTVAAVFVTGASDSSAYQLVFASANASAVTPVLTTAQLVPSHAVALQLSRSA